MTKFDKQKIIGKTIKDKRRKMKLTQLEVAEKTDLSRNYISDIENGRYMPSVNTLIKLVDFLGMDLNFLTSLTEIQV
ncbi:helix-turn-helix domain-containing protein [Clostridium brassicae]|uniref:Helix-turn-helix transcriptional regulator n=1 Tax=Clostridium brassicae TaxID=2999072 RepID=A0ABT4D940_9CLOT|nr:helix-turn-helix transcriptional regulator [Clostridium brassicae]MCY6958830.1 helix-turn-helix transcriptional regulator [Clostridium brassicae]